MMIKTKLGLSNRYYYYYIKRKHKKLSEEFGLYIADKMTNILQEIYFGDISRYDEYKVEIKKENKIIQEKKILKKIMEVNNETTKKRGRL